MNWSPKWSPCRSLWLSSCRLLTKYSCCFCCPAQLRQAVLRSLGIRGFLRRHPFARRASRKQQARHFNMICAVLRRVSPAFTCPHQWCRSEHAIDGIHRRAVRQQNLYCFHVAAHRGTMECFHSVAVLCVWIEATLQHCFESLRIAAFGPSVHHQVVLWAKLVAQIRILLEQRACLRLTAGSTRRN